MLKTNKKPTEKYFSHYLLACSLLVLSTQVFASNEPKSEITDSVFTWGTWEYNIAPAAGDVHNTNASPLNPRSAKVTLRTNSNAALAPTGAAELTPNIRPTIPATPPAPIIITQAPQPPVVIPTIPAPPAATPSVPVTPQAAPNIGVGNTPGGTSTAGTGGFNFSF